MKWRTRIGAMFNVSAIAIASPTCWKYATALLWLGMVTPFPSTVRACPKNAKASVALQRACG